MRYLSLTTAATIAVTCIAFAQSSEPTYSVSIGANPSTKATVAVRYASDGAIDAATVTIARTNSPKRDQSRITSDEIARAPGVLTPLKLFVTETWEAGENPLDVGELRKLVLTGFTKASENITLERLADDRATGHRNYLLDGPISHWKFSTDGRRLVKLSSGHGVRIQRD